MGSGRVAKLAKAIPDYPGRAALEAALMPLVEPASKKVAGTFMQRLLGYWVMAHMFGGRDALIEKGLLSQASAYRSEREFLETFGMSVADLTVDKVLGGVEKKND